VSEVSLAANMESQQGRTLVASSGHQRLDTTIPDEKHVMRASDYLLRLQPQMRPGTTQKLEASLRRRGCCAYQAPVPLVAVAACLRDFVSEEDTCLFEALGPFKSFRPSCSVESALAASAAARVALSLHRKQTSLGMLLAQNTWADCRVEPQALVEALIGTGAVLQAEAGAGRLGYNEHMLAEHVNRPCKQNTAQIPVETVDVDLGGLFEAKVRVQALREVDGGIAAAVQKWLRSACEVCLLKGQPQIDFTRTRRTLSFSFTPGTPELVSRVLGVVRRDLQESFSPGLSSFTVPVTVNPLFGSCRGPRLRALQEWLKCSVSLDEDLPGFVVATGGDTTASEEEIRMLVEKLFGEGSVFPCGCLPYESLGRFIGKNGQHIMALEQMHGVNLHCEVPADEPQGRVQLFGCIAPGSLRSATPSDAAADLRARFADIPGRIAAALEDVANSPLGPARVLPNEPLQTPAAGILRNDAPRRLATATWRRVAPMLGGRLVTLDELRAELHGQGITDDKEVSKLWASLLYPLLESFDDADLDEELLRGVYSYGFERPSAVQQRAILPIIDGRDTIAQAQSGTGKTATFVIGVLQRIDYTTSVCQALMLAPSRELAVQIYNVVRALGEYLQVRCHCCIGGTSVRGDIDQLRRGQQVVVGMPGRVYDMISKRHLRVNHIDTFVLDEADEMLSRGMKDQVYDIFRTLPPNVAVAAFSATMPQEFLDLSTRFMRDSVRILVQPGHLLLEGISQFYVSVEREEWKLDIIADLHESLVRTGQAIIYSNTRRKVDWLADQLHGRGVVASCLHAELDQRERELVMREFRAGHARLLLTTDSLARGIDVQQVKVVVNFDMPACLENYLHRIGRCGRFGRRGAAISLITNSDVSAMQDVERHFETQIEELPLDFETRL